MCDYDNSFWVEMLLFFQSQWWKCPVAAQEERDEETQEQVSMTEAVCFGFFGHEGP